MTKSATLLREIRALVPVRTLTKDESRNIAERQAVKLLELLGVTEGPVDLAPLMRLPNIEIRLDSRLATLGISGLSESRRGGWTITINQTDSTTRRRFTLAHEFKHVLDHPFVRVLYPDAHSEQQAEQICDYFAACLLMPRVWVKSLWYGGLQDIEALAARFRVSPAAMNRRLQDLKITESPRRHGTRSNFDVARYFRKSTELQLSAA